MDRIDKVSDIFADMVNMAMKMEDRAVKTLSARDLSVAEIRTLEAIGLDSAKSMSQVVQSLNVSMGTLTAAVNKLVGKDYVERFRIPQDRRVVKIKLTDKGRRAVEEHNQLRRRMVRQAVEDMDAEEVDMFIDGMVNISQFVAMSQYRPLRDRKDYSLSPIKLGNLTLPVTLVQGGMGIGVSLGGLAGAVAAQGGLGLVSGVEPGFSEADFSIDPLGANRRVLQREIKKALHIAETTAGSKGKGLVGVNVTASRPYYGEMVKTAIASGAQVIVSGGGLPMSLPALCQGSDIALIPIVSSARAAGLITRSWKKKHNCRPAAFIFESSQAGGYLGYKESQLESVRDDFYKNLLEIREEIKELPMIVAGGIVSRKDAVRSYAYGADGIQIGTGFIPTKECDASPGFKEAYLNLDENDVTIIRNPQGMPCRVINNPYVKKLKEDPEREISAKEERKALLRALAGDKERGLFFCGSRAYRMKPVTTVEQVFREFI